MIFRLRILYNDYYDGLDYVTKVILQEARLEERLTNQLLVTMLSAYSKNPINLLINAPSGVGKNYVINKVVSLFPKGDVLILAGMTEKALFHRPGTLVIQNEETGEYESIEKKLMNIDDKIDGKMSESYQTSDKCKKQEIKNAIRQIEINKKNLLKDAKKLINLENKVIIFLDTPPEHLILGLLPLLSHDEYEVEYEFADTHNGIKTHSNVLRGWPVVIIAQALDYSKSPRYKEIERRFITTNPTMSKEKYNEAINLILDKSSVPDLIYQHKVVSNYEKDKAREIIKDLKEQIQTICSDLEPGKNNTIIPFDDLIRQSIPKEKVADMTKANRLATYLRFLPVVYFDKRPHIEVGIEGDILSKQILPIATFEDLLNANFLMRYSDGVRPYLLEWFYDIFLEAYKAKGNIKDSKANSKGDELIENRVALTSQDIIKKHKEQHNETLTTHKLLQSYLYPLMNHGYIDSVESVLDRRSNIYYPLIETKENILLFYLGEKNNFSQQKEKIVVNSTIFISKEHIISKIEPILGYYSENGFYTKIKNNLDEEISLKELVNQYFANPEYYFEVKKEEEEEEKETDKPQQQQEKPNKEEEEEIERENETPEEKYKREQEEMKNWNSGLV